MLREKFALVALGVLTTVGAPLHAICQVKRTAAVPVVPVVQLRPDPSCSTCRIRATIVATIPDDVFEIETTPVAVAHNSKGNYLVGGKNGTLGVFDQRGTLLRTFGRRGGGPGEFQAITRIYVGYQDSVLVYDVHASRVTVLDPGLTRVVRTFPLVAQRGIVPLHNGSFVTSASLATTGNAGPSLHSISVKGAVLKSASADSAVARRQSARRLGQSLSFINETSFVAASTHQYRFELWSPDLRLQRVFERIVDWFPPHSEAQVVDIPSRTPLPMQLSSVTASGSDGMVIAQLSSGSSNFKPDPKVADRRREVSARDMASGSSLNQYIDTTIEFIDLTSGFVLASARFPGMCRPVFQPPNASMIPLYCIVRETASGGEAFEIVRCDLEGRTK